MRIALTTAAALLAATAMAAGPVAAAPASPPPPQATRPSPAVPTTPGELVAWAKDHPRQSAIVVWREGDRRPLLSLGAERRMPLASTRKVLILLAASRAAVGGRLDLTAPVPQAELDRWYLPGTDGGAHPAALEAYGDDWTVRTALQAMITFSDNAAADWLLARVGGPAVVDRLVHRLGLRQQDPIWSLRGEYLAWASEPRAWLAASPQRRQAIATRLARTSSGPVPLDRFPGADEQRRLALASVRGSMGEWALLTRFIHRRAVAGDDAARLATEVLSWPLADPANADAFDVFATKGGAFVGVVTEATAIRAKGGRTYYVAQAYRALPTAVEQQLRTTFLQQQLYLDLALGRFSLG